MMNHQQKCSQCLEHFSLGNPPRSMPSCVHNICTKCLQQAIKNHQQFIQCQFCTKRTKQKEIKLFPKNIKLIERIKLNTTSSSILSQQLAASYISSSQKNTLNLCSDDDELLIPLNTLNEDNNQSEDFCKIHNKSLDIICATQKKRICPHCAIFGNHKDHRFRTINQFQNEIKEKTLQFKSILRRKQIQSNSETLLNIEHKINQKILDRKIMISRQICRNFEQLINSIRKVQKSIEINLQQKFEQTKLKINQELSQQIKIKQKFNKWEISCQQTLYQLESAKNIAQKVQIFYQSSLQICREGQYFFQQMITKMSELYKNTTYKIDAISINNQQKSFDNYISLVFPLLQESYIEKQLAQIKESFQKDLPQKAFVYKRQKISENSFLFDDVSSIKSKQQIKYQKSPRNMINKSLLSFTSLKSIGKNSNITIITNTPTRMQKNNDEKQKKQTILNRARSSKRVFKSPQFIKASETNKSPEAIKSSEMIKSPQKKKHTKTLQQIYLQLVSNQFINEIDLVEYGLSNKQIFGFFQKLKFSRPLKAVKLQKNNLTDQGLDSICQFLSSVSNLNVSSNKLTQKCFDILIKNKANLTKMKMINLSYNKFSLNRTQKGIKDKLDELKKFGILITL